jgi:pimeloyl-ACP methyl ester carboxylesterase
LTTFVLVHGAWTGAHIWQRLRPLLWSRAGPVFTPALTGLGERSHLAHPGIDLDLHVRDVLATMRYERLDDVTLVGHSYGATVAAMAADQVPRRIRRLVCLDALLPADGESFQDLRRHPAPAGDWIVPPQVRAADPALRDRVLEAARLSPQPALTFRQPVRLATPLERQPFARTYVRAAGRNPSPGYDRAAAHARASSMWTYHEMAAGHDLVLTHAPELADLLCVD